MYFNHVVEMLVVGAGAAGGPIQYGPNMGRQREG